MGYNSVIVCEIHQKCVYSMRGEEHVDIQQLFRTRHRNCMKQGKVTLHCDQDIDHAVYEDFWPFDQRPALVGIKQRFSGVPLPRVPGSDAPISVWR